MLQLRVDARARIPFRAVNRRGAPNYRPGLQRHHILPRQLLSQQCFGHLFESIGRQRIGFDDFRCNGLLLPASEEAALRLQLPLHRGPHRDYNSMVIERVGEIEERWSSKRLRSPGLALQDALERMGKLQDALRAKLYGAPGSVVLNRKDPLGHGFDFTELDAMAETLFRAR